VDPETGAPPSLVNIAFVSTVLGFPLGGADTLWAKAAETAAARGDRLLLSISPLAAGHERVRGLADAGAKLVIRHPPPTRATFAARLRRKLGLVPDYDARLIRALQSFRPDLVIFSHGGTYDLVLHPALTAWLRSSGIRYRLIANWQEEHPQLDEANLAFIRAAFVAADRLNFVSTRNLAVTRRHLGLPLPNAQVIQNPLRWQPTDVAPWPAGPVTRLATVSRLDEGKGIQLLLQALADCDGKLPDWQLNICGQGPYESQLRAAAAPLGQRVQFRGYVKQLRDIWAENHLMISPALEDGVPMTIPEAMLCQRPVLATCVGGAEDWLENGRTGFLCPTRDADTLAATLRHAFTARDQWEAMGRAAAEAAAGRYRAEDHFLLIS
jgi:glycosyltransferase involved in cell wall biosynthesis